MTMPAGGLEYVRRVIGDDVDAVELGECLCGHCDKDAGTVAFEHVAVRPLALLALEQDVHLDFAVLIARLGVVDVTTAVQVGDHDDAFLIMIVVQEPSEILLGPQRWARFAGATVPWGLNNHQAAEGKQAAHNTLHGQWDSP